MCDADDGVIVYNWLKHHKAPHTNFNVQHQCRNFDAVLEYARSHRINASSLEQQYFLKPKDGSIVEFDEPPYDPQADE